MNERARVYYLLGYTSVVTTSFMGARLAVPLLAIKLGASKIEIGVAMALFALLPMLLSMHFGRWVDRIGIATPLIATASGMSLSLALAFVFPEMWMLYLLCSMTGLGVVGFNVAASIATGGLSRPETRMGNFALLSLSAGIASFVGPVIAGYLIEALGYGATFGVLALPPACVAGAIALRVHTRGPRPRNAEPPAAGHVRELLRVPTVRGVLVLASLIGMSWDVYAFLVPIYGTAIGHPPKAIGNILGASGFAMFAIRLAVPMLARRFLERQIAIASLTFCALVFAVFPFADAVFVLIGLSLLFGAALGAGQPATTSLLYSVAPPGRTAEVMALRSTIQNGIHTAVPALVGVLGAAVGTQPVFWGIGALLLAGGWLARRPR